jgi:hypothetical protein
MYATCAPCDVTKRCKSLTSRNFNWIYLYALSAFETCIWQATGQKYNNPYIAAYMFKFLCTLQTKLTVLPPRFCHTIMLSIIMLKSYIVVYFIYTQKLQFYTKFIWLLKRERNIIEKIIYKIQMILQNVFFFFLYNILLSDFYVR